jgi:phosphatidylserine decarboxylase
MKNLKKNISPGMKVVVCLVSTLPLRLLSRCARVFANARLGAVLQPLIRFFSKKYNIDLSEAELDVADFKTFNGFFDRRLKKGARRIDPGAKSVVSPVDGTILSLGSLSDGIIIEAKGTGSKLDDLLCMPGFKQRFIDGDFIVIYLSPRDYHRIHAPLGANIIGYSHIPGRLYPVNSFAVNNIDRLFSTNERLITYMETRKNRVCALVKVGATNVGSIRVTYEDSLRTNRFFSRKTKEMFLKGIPIEKGEEIAWFELGSTVILLFEKNMAKLGDVKAGDRILLGEAIATLK